jgi:hypothetical protein
MMAIGLTAASIFMFYLTKRTSISERKVGDECIVLADFSGIPTGSKGHIDEIYRRGVMVQWRDILDPVINYTATPNGEHLVAHHIATRPRRDGFSEDELEYLAFARSKRPNVQKSIPNEEAPPLKRRCG